MHRTYAWDDDDKALCRTTLSCNLLSLITFTGSILTIDSTQREGSKKTGFQAYWLYAHLWWGCLAPPELLHTKRAASVLWRELSHLATIIDDSSQKFNCKSKCKRWQRTLQKSIFFWSPRSSARVIKISNFDWGQLRNTYRILYWLDWTAVVLSATLQPSWDHCRIHSLQLFVRRLSLKLSLVAIVSTNTFALEIAERFLQTW